jgi:hypothetical protein
VPSIKHAGTAPQDMQKLCFDWYKNLRTMKNIKVDESDVLSEVKADLAADLSDVGNY